MANHPFLTLLDRALDAINKHLVIGGFDATCPCYQCVNNHALAKAQTEIQRERAKILYPNLDHGTQASGEAQTRPGLWAILDSAPRVGEGKGPLAQGS